MCVPTQKKPLREAARMDKVAEMALCDAMKTMSAKDAKNAFGLLLDTARAEPVSIAKHGRRVVVVISVEEYERLVEEGTKSIAGVSTGAAHKTKEG